MRPSVIRQASWRNNHDVVRPCLIKQAPWLNDYDIVRPTVAYYFVQRDIPVEEWPLCILTLLKYRIGKLALRIV